MRKSAFIPPSKIRRAGVNILNKSASVGLKQATFEEVSKLTTEGLANYAKSTLERIKIPTPRSVGAAIAPFRGARATEIVESGAVSAVTNSACLYVYAKPRKNINKYLGQKYVQTKVVTDPNITSTVNVQNYMDCNIACVERPQSDVATNARYAHLCIRDCFDTLLTPEVRKAGTAGTLVIPEDSTSMHIGSISSELTINMGSSAGVLDIYDLVPKFDLGPATYFSGTFANGYMSPSWCFESITTNSIQLDSAYAATTTSLRPTDSPTFSRTWKVIKKTRLQLTTNSVHRHNSYYGINTTISYQRMAQASTAGSMFAGICPVIMIVYRGYPSATNNVADSITFNASRVIRMTYSSVIGQGTRSINYSSIT